MIELNLFHSTNNPLKKASKKSLNLKDDKNNYYHNKDDKIHNNKNDDNCTKRKEILNKQANEIEIINSKRLLISKRYKKYKSRTENQRKASRKESNNLMINENPEEQTKASFRRKSNKKAKIIEKNEYGLKTFISDEHITKKEINSVPYTQALRIDNRNIFEIFLSVLFHEIQIIDIFYYKDNYKQLSITLSIYVFELCLDLTLNCLLYTDDVVSEKYNNNGSIKFFTSLTLSFMSNIFASIIALIIGKLAEYASIMELMIKDEYKKNIYLLNVVKFKKYITIKLVCFFIIQTIINFLMCYYLMIFCTVYHKTQGSIMINYLIGVAESMIISLGLTLITSIIRFLSIKNKWMYVYNTSKYLLENF